MKRTSKVKKIVNLRRARISQNLGDGFRRHVFDSVTLASGQYQQINIFAPSDRVVVTGGWSSSAGSNDRVYATDNYPATDTRWTIYIKNESNDSISITPYLITKRD